MFEEGKKCMLKDSSCKIGKKRKRKFKQQNRWIRWEGEKNKDCIVG